MRIRTVLLTAAVTLVLATGVSARDRIAAAHVRPLSPDGAALIADSQQKSATVRNLVSRLEAGNLVAYVNVVPASASPAESTLNFVGSSRVQRFVQITIAASASADRRIELLGHELQHAVEVAGLPWVKNDSQFQDMMKLMGWRDAGAARGYETTAATVTESKIRREVHTTGTPR